MKTLNIINITGDTCSSKLVVLRSKGWSFKFLSVHITVNLSWLHAHHDSSEASLFPKEIGSSAWTSASPQTSTGAAWYGTGTALPTATNHSRVVEVAQHITDNRFPAIQDISHQRCLQKVHSIIKGDSQTGLADDAETWQHIPPD